MASYALSVRDAGRQAEFYQRAVGLELQDRTRNGAVLGMDGVPLLHLEQRTGLLQDDPKAAGLHHLAFLMPTRANLADWYRHSRQIGLTITRTGDHHVNEALYYDDPEGNGCECYADRPSSHWQWDGDGKVHIPAVPVDLDSLIRDESAPAGDWQPPLGLRIGHINLRVGDLDASEAFYCSLLGLDHTCRRDIMTFMANGGYHHHMAANIMTSPGAGRRDENAPVSTGSASSTTTASMELPRATVCAVRGLGQRYRRRLRGDRSMGDQSASGEDLICGASRWAFHAD